MLGNHGAERAFQTLELVQCKHHGFREALVNFKALYQKHAALFILTIWLYLKHIGPDQVKFTFYPPPPTSAARKELCKHGPSISGLCKAHITGSVWTFNPLQIVKNAPCIKADTAFKQISKKFMPWIQIKGIRVITRFVVRALGARKMRGV